MRFLRENGLSLFFGAIFLLTVWGQSMAGHRVFNEEQLEHGSEPVSWGRYVLSSDFGEAVLENWESEWLQMFLFALATIWLIQRGSVESKPPGDEGLESDEKQKIGGRAQENSPRWAKVRGWRTTLYSWSLTLVLAGIFLGSWFAQSVTGWTQFNDEQREHDEPTISWGAYVTEPDFWEKTLQNWQSEFLALGTMVILTVYLRQRGSPESKSVGTPHEQTPPDVG